MDDFFSSLLPLSLSVAVEESGIHLLKRLGTFVSHPRCVLRNWEAKLLEHGSSEEKAVTVLCVLVGRLQVELCAVAVIK